MTQVSEIVEQAFRESITDVTQHPTPTQFNEGLDRLNKLVKSVYGTEVGQPLEDWPLGTAGTDPEDPSWVEALWAYPAPNSRLVVALATSQAVYLPQDPMDGARMGIIDPRATLAATPVTLYGNGRSIEGAATLVINTNSTSKEWLYRADLGNWTVLSTLAATDDFPFPEEFDDFFITMLAMRLNPRYGRSLDEASIVTLDRSRSKLRARYRQRSIVGVDPGLTNTTVGYGSIRGQRTVRPSRFGWMY